MTKTTHMNRGSCQACGRLQAVDNVSRIVAKHGYTVDFGYFNGVCPGGRGYKPAELDVSLTHRTIIECTAIAKDHDAHVVALKDGSEVPTTFERWNSDKVVTKRSRRGMSYQTSGGYDTLPIAQATEQERKDRIAGEIHHNEQRAAGLRAHCTFLVHEILPRLGRPLAPNLEQAKVERKAAKAKAIEGVAFPTKQSRKDALDKLSRAYDKARHELQNLYLALPHGERTEAKTAVYYGPMLLNHWRPKHAEAAIREFPESAFIVARINDLVKQRDVIKNTP